MNKNIQVSNYHKRKGLFWMRVFGHGIHIKDTTIHKPLFSERNGYTKRLKIGKWSITYLRPIKL